MKEDTFNQSMVIAGAWEATHSRTVIEDMSM